MFWINYERDIIDSWKMNYVLSGVHGVSVSIFVLNFSFLSFFLSTSDKKHRLSDVIWCFIPFVIFFISIIFTTSERRDGTCQRHCARFLPKGSKQEWKGTGEDKEPHSSPHVQHHQPLKGSHQPCSPGPLERQTALWEENEYEGKWRGTVGGGVDDAAIGDSEESGAGEDIVVLLGNEKTSTAVMTWITTTKTNLSQQWAFVVGITLKPFLRLQDVIYCICGIQYRVSSKIWWSCSR